MVIYNAATRELTAKIVYYGPGLGGKTTNLQVLHDRLEPSTVGKLLNLSTQSDRTIYFDLLPVELGDIKGYKIRFQLATVPGQTAFNETRRVVLKGADGIVFVADSQWTMLPKNLESWQNLKDNLGANGVAFEGMPVVIQYNKRDLTDILSIEAMQEALGLSSFPFVEAVASAGRGVTETFKLVSKLTFVDLLRRLQGRRPEDASLPTGREEKDDLLTWKQSLFQKGAGAAPPRPRPVQAAPPSEEPPFETEEPSGADTSPGAAEGPFAAATSGDQTNPSPSRGAAPDGGVPAAVAAEAEPLEVIEELDAESAVTPREPEPVETLPQPLEAEAPTGTWDGARPAAAAALDTAPLRELETRFAARVDRLEKTAREAREGSSRAQDLAGALSARLEALEKRAEDLWKGLSEARQALEARFDSLEDRARGDGREIARISDLAQRMDAVTPKLDAYEQLLQAGLERLNALAPRLEAHEQRLDNGFRALEAQEKRQRATEDDVGMALASLSERGEKLQQQMAALGSALEGLEKTLEEKIGQGHREAEDIRTQLAPLLEAHGQRRAEDERLLSEIDRLREGMADSLADLAERLRRAVRALGS